MRRILKIIPAVFFLAACSESTKAPVPTPGTNQVPQIFVLSDAKNPIVNFWGFPSRDALADGLAARVEWEAVSNQEAAAEKLHVWSARPMTLLILGPGLPSVTYAGLDLPKVPGRKILMLGQPTPVKEASSIEIAPARMAAFVGEFCKLKTALKGCRVLPKDIAALPEFSKIGSADGAKVVFIGASRDTLEDGTPVTLNVVVRWKDWLQSVLADKGAAAAPRARMIDFFSGDIEARRGPGMSAGLEVVEFDKMRQDFMMHELQKGSFK